MLKKYSFNLAVTIVFSVSIIFLFVCEKKVVDKIALSSFSSPETVIIDPGHGGEDGGAVGGNVLLEKDINLQVSKKLELILNLHGINTDMTRRDDISLGENVSNSLRSRKVADIKKRIEKILSNANAVVVSIHQNSFPQDENCFGSQVFYSGNNIKSEILAKNVQFALKDGINNNNTRSEKKADKSIFLLEKINCPAILVECGFLSNPAELVLLDDELYQLRLAACIASGFFEYKREM